MRRCRSVSGAGSGPSFPWTMKTGCREVTKKVLHSPAFSVVLHGGGKKMLNTFCRKPHYAVTRQLAMTAMGTKKG